MSDNTYGSYDLRCARLTDIKGRHIKEDTLFLNTYDYWTNFHNPNKIYFWWKDELLSKLERNIRRKKYLPVVDILFEKIKAKDIWFNPLDFYKDYDSEKYFELLILWKEKSKKEHLPSRPQFKPYRHKKAKAKKTIRG